MQGVAVLVARYWLLVRLLLLGGGPPLAWRLAASAVGLALTVLLGLVLALAASRVSLGSLLVGGRMLKDSGDRQGL